MVAAGAEGNCGKLIVPSEKASEDAQHWGVTMLFAGRRERLIPDEVAERMGVARG